MATAAKEMPRGAPGRATYSYEQAEQITEARADAFLKENPRFTGQGYKVVSTGKPDGGSGTSQTTHDSINASIRSAFGR